MNNVPCGVIGDLLPLYAEAICSEQSGELVEAHLRECEKCRQLYETIKKAAPLPSDDGDGLKRLNAELRTRRLRVSAIAALFVFVLLLSAFHWLSAPRYIPYSAGLTQVSESGDYIIISFPESVPRVNMEYGANPDTGAMEYFISAWTSPWDQIMKGGARNQISIYNGDGEPKNIYYCWEAHGENTELLYGEKDGDSGLYILPRLVLGYYALCALALLIVSGLAWLLLRKKRAGGILRQIFFAPVSYLTGHVLMKGLRTLSFNSGRDFVFILSAACAVYAILTLVRQELAQKRADRA